MKKNNKGFTLIELLAVTIILLVIIFFAFTKIKSTSENAKKKSVKANALSYYKIASDAAISTKGSDEEFKLGLFSVNELLSMKVKANGTNPDGGFIYFKDFEIVCGCLQYKSLSVSIDKGKYSEVEDKSCSMADFDDIDLSDFNNYDYSGSEQTFTASKDGVYKLEVWGAQGGNSKFNSFEETGGYGAYSVGYLELEANDVLYINVGGQGESTKYQSGGNVEYYGSNGYNGGNLATTVSNTVFGGGGGASSITLSSGLLKTFKNNISDVIIVAGGGGGAVTHASYPSYSGKGGSGGGYIGSNGVPSSNTCYNYGTGGSQIAVGSYLQCEIDGSGRQGTQPSSPDFGLGGGVLSRADRAYAGGGGGFYGGQSGCHGPGGGGSGYIANPNLFTKHMSCYNCLINNESSTKTKTVSCVSSNPVPECAKEGNGYVKITYIDDETSSDVEEDIDL